MRGSGYKNQEISNILFDLGYKTKNGNKFNRGMITKLYNQSKLIPKKIINHPRMGIINIHQSLLPAYKGRHPLNWAIINGEKYTGVTIHKINEAYDDGEIINLNGSRNAFYLAISSSVKIWKNVEYSKFNILYNKNRCKKTFLKY